MPAAPSSGRLMSAADAARYLGISRATLDTLSLEGKLPGRLKLGARVLFDRAALDRFIDERVGAAASLADGEARWLERIGHAR